MEAYAGQQFVGIDLHRRRSVIVRTTDRGDPLETVRISNDVDSLSSLGNPFGTNRRQSRCRPKSSATSVRVTLLDGLTPPETARPLGIPANTAKTRLLRRDGHRSNQLLDRRFVMSVRRFAAVVMVALGSIAVLAPGAQAAPPSAQFDGTYTCSNGQSIDVFVNNHSLVGYVDGKGVAPRAFRFISDVSLEVQDGAYAGDVISQGVDSGISGPSGKPTNGQTLTGTSACVKFFSGEIEFVIDQGAVDFLGIDPKYLGSTVSGSEDSSITVYVTTQQLQHR
jgi:hypothetical protein